jgi:hypothetical protein
LCVPLDEAAVDAPRERLPEDAEDAVPRSWRKRLVPVLDLDAAEAVGVPVAELSAYLAELCGHLPDRQRVERAAVLLEEHVQQFVDGLRPVAGGDEVAAADRRDLVYLRPQPRLSRGLRLESALVAADALLVVVAGAVVALAA